MKHIWVTLFVNDKNIEKRRNQGLATINQIISMLNMTSLGHYYFEIALILRESILVSKLIFNSEVWYNLSNKQIEKLEQIDEIYLRKILNCPKTTPKVGIYLECGVMPLNFIIKIRRLLYYWHILHRDKGELIFKFYTVQSYSPSEGDWVQLVKKDMADIKLGLSEEEIKTMSKYQFKKIEKQKVVKLAASNLESRRKHKSMKLEIMKFEPQEYLLSKNLSISEVQTLFKIRNNMIQVKENFKSSHENLLCRLCLLCRESQQHLIDCTEIRKKLRGVVDFDNLKIEMAFMSTKNQEILAKSYNIVINTWKDLLSL